MKEYPFTFDDGLKKGLRRWDTNPTNEQALVECHNLAPAELGLKPHEPLKSVDASGLTWGGLGSKTEPVYLRNITIDISDYVDDDDIAGASVYIDGTLYGVTDSDGELDVVNIAVGSHSLKVTKSGYIDSDTDNLLNDDFVVA